MTARRWTAAEDRRLEREYLEYRNAGNLAELAAKMGRSKQFICRKARALGLTDRNRPAAWARTWKDMTEDEAADLLEKFRTSDLGLGDFCQSEGIGEVGFWKTMTKFFPGTYHHVVESKFPRHTAYHAGRAFEYRTLHDLKERGYFVLRSPMSKSPVDLTAIRRGEILLVQCRSHGALAPREWNELLELASSVGAIPVKACELADGDVGYMRMDGPKTPGARVPEPGEEFVPASEVAS